jgi:predicted dehydrogenase
LAALVSGHPDKARRLAQVHGVDAEHGIYNYESFDRIAQDPAIDVVYIVLPNSLHAEFTVRALRAGKHVLCEKPMATSVAEAEQMIAAAQTADRQLGIAYRLHHEPMNLAVMALCRDKAVGEIRTFTSSNCQDVKAPNIRLSAKLGGGPLGDLGVYSINAARYVLNEEPIEVMAFAQQPDGDPRFREVPETVSYLLRYPSGALASCDCSFGTGNSSRYRAVGTKGFIEMDPAFPYEGQKLRVSEQQGEDKVRLTEPKFKAVNQFAEEFDHFSQSALTRQPFATPGEIGLADMRIVTALNESRRTGQPVKMG